MLLLKTLQELTLLDRFLFDEAMEDRDTYEALLRILLGDEELKLLSEPESEKELRTAPWLRSIRVDVFAMDEETIYNTEMQQGKRDDLMKRSRYYQALIDSSLLEPGNTDFNTIKNTTIIMITPFDLFGEDRFIYTFEAVCSESPGLKMNDGSKRIFINTHGKNTQDVSAEFLALMRFIEYNEDEQTSMTQSENYAKIVARVAAIKASEKVGVRYMNRWEEEDIIRHDAKEEGRAEGVIETIRNIMQNTKQSFEEVCNMIGISGEEQQRIKKML